MGFKSQQPNRYIAADGGNTEPIRRPLPLATFGDRILIFLFVFLVGTIVTAAGYWYLSADVNFDSVPLATKTGDDARLHFGLVSLTGGLLAIAVYAVISLVDPYGNHTAAKADKAAKEKKALLLEEIRRNQERRK